MLHDDIRTAMHRIEAMFNHLDDAGMIEAGQDMGFLEEALAQRRINFLVAGKTENFHGETFRL